MITCSPSSEPGMERAITFRERIGIAVQWVEIPEGSFRGLCAKPLVTYNHAGHVVMIFSALYVNRTCVHVPHF